MEPLLRAFAGDMGTDEGKARPESWRVADSWVPPCQAAFLAFSNQDNSSHGEQPRVQSPVPSFGRDGALREAAATTYRASSEGRREGLGDVQPRPAGGRGAAKVITSRSRSSALMPARPSAGPAVLAGPGTRVTSRQGPHSAPAPSLPAPGALRPGSSSHCPRCRTPPGSAPAERRQEDVVLPALAGSWAKALGCRLCRWGPRGHSRLSEAAAAPSHPSPDTQPGRVRFPWCGTRLPSGSPGQEAPAGGGRTGPRRRRRAETPAVP